jgi:hypothetical protein
MHFGTVIEESRMETSVTVQFSWIAPDTFGEKGAIAERLPVVLAVHGARPRSRAVAACRYRDDSLLG